MSIGKDRRDFMALQQLYKDWSVLLRGVLTKAYTVTDGLFGDIRIHLFRISQTCLTSLVDRVSLEDPLGHSSTP